ncbi:MAG TPA: glycerophosphodiester phosphodiesterase family protein [Thermoanaerobaculia bacterium]|nr:glycerophosphodiester phosphodiesterase family protein [Thermoanaerobaculia bacterium]
MKIIAHRGLGQAFIDPDSPPENTLPSFAAAWELGAVACELDVQVTSDDKAIVIHDQTTERTTNANWIVAQHTAAELQSLDAGRWKAARWSGTCLPLLSEVIDELPDGRQLYVELKDGPQVVPAAMRAVRDARKSPEQIIFKSFDIDTIAAMKVEMPSYSCFLLVAFQGDVAQGRWNMVYDEGPNFRPVVQPYVEEDVLALLRCYSLDGIDTSFVMPPSLVRLMRDARLELVTWTINDPLVARDLMAMGVEVITTDVPALLTRALT